jgi:hypothetical protein
MRILGMIVGLAALALATTAAAQTNEPAPAAPPASAAPARESAPTSDDSTPVQGLIVTGHRRPPVRDMPAAIDRFVRSHGAATRRIDQIPRWEWQTPICVVTAGLDPEFNAFITKRIVEVATSVGAPVAKPKPNKSKPNKPCQSSVEILFSDDPQGLVGKIFKRQDELMGYHFAPNVPTLAHFDPPIKAWYLTGTRGRSGFAIDSIWTQEPSGSLGSRISTGLRAEFVNILVVAQIRDVIGYEIGPISDYLAMLVLTQPHSLSSCDPLPSILDLMSPNCGDADKPKTLTREDLAYLKALYSVDAVQSATLERSDIWNRMKRELAAH